MHSFRKHAWSLIYTRLPAGQLELMTPAAIQEYPGPSRHASCAPIPLLHPAKSPSSLLLLPLFSL